MTSASVGFHCPECIAEAKATFTAIGDAIGGHGPERELAARNTIEGSTAVER